jgi:hypothetical protein
VIPRLAVALVLAASLAVVGMLDAQPVGAIAPPVQYRDVVEVGADGNGFSAGSFVAEASDRVRFVAVVRAGPDVQRLSLTLNATAVLVTEDGAPGRVPIPDGVVQDGDNHVVLTATGAAGSSVRLRIIAERTAPQDQGPPPPHAPRFRGRVRVGGDGNGVSAGSFEAHAPDRMRFVAVVVHGPVAVDSLSLTVNATPVLVSEDDLPGRVPIPEGVIQDGDNNVVLSARGAPGSTARVTILAVRPEPPPPRPPHLAQLRARVRVGADGNGARAASFVADPTDATRYALAVRPAGGLRSLSVTLNATRVLVAEDGAPRRVPIPGGVVQDGDNHVVLTATGPAGSAATVTIVAVRTEVHDPRPALEQRLQFRGRALVGADGNGALAALFSTTVAAPRYMAVADRLCGAASCAPAVRDFDVVLNGTVVAQGSGRASVPVALAPPGSDENRLTVTVRGLPGAGVRVRVFAVRPTLISSQGGARLARAPATRGLTAPLGSTKGSVRGAFLPEIGDEVL